MKTDVVIIGGGPAACSAALSILKRGFSVAVIANETRIEKPTESASPKLPKMLQVIGAESALSTCDPCLGFCSAWGRDTPTFEPSLTNPLGHAWFVHREEFDSSLRKLAVRAGAKWTVARCQTVDFGESQVFAAANNDKFFAKWVIFATGSPSLPAKLTGQRTSQLDCLVAYWARLPAPFDARLLFVEPVDDGWWYLCPARKQGAVACLVTDTSIAKKAHFGRSSSWQTHFQKTHLCKQFEFRSLIPRVHGASISLAALPRRSGGAWSAIGDSAMKLDPLGSFGNMGALESGWRAGDAIADVLNGKSNDVEIYERWSQKLFDEFVRQRSLQYANEAQRRKTTFWAERLRFSDYRLSSNPRSRN